MLEILGVVLLTRWAREACTANGRTAWLSAAVPIAWFTAEIIVALILVIVTQDELAGAGGGLAAGFVSGGLTAFVIRTWVVNNPQLEADHLGLDTEEAHENPWAS